MGRPKKKVEAVPSTSETQSEAVTPKVTKVKVEEAKPQEIRKGDTHLVFVNGESRYWTKVQILIEHRRAKRKIELPNGSSIVLPAGGGCQHCG